MNVDLTALETRLRRRLSATERKSIGHLNHVPDELVHEARTLNDRRMAEQLLRYYTGEPPATLHSFVDQVVLGGKAASDWRRGRVLICSFSLPELLSREPAEILAVFPGKPGQLILPDFERWSQGLPAVGAPALVQPDADYRTPVPRGTMDLNVADTASIGDVQITLNRWIATRLAMVLVRRGMLDDFHIPMAKVAGLPAWREWSHCARLAAEALLRERRQLPRVAQELPGFRGEDAWYSK